jgi:hypothetical protein
MPTPRTGPDSLISCSFRPEAARPRHTSAWWPTPLRFAASRARSAAEVTRVTVAPASPRSCGTRCACSRRSSISEQPPCSAPPRPSAARRFSPQNVARRPTRGAPSRSASGCGSAHASPPTATTRPRRTSSGCEVAWPTSRRVISYSLRDAHGVPGRSRQPRTSSATTCAVASSCGAATPTANVHSLLASRSDSARAFRW